MRPLTLRMIVGVYRPDLEEDPAHVRPTVAGCVDEDMWEITPIDEWDAITRKMREDFATDSQDYEWREILVELDMEAVRAAVIPPRLQGVVKEADAGAS